MTAIRPRSKSGWSGPELGRRLDQPDVERMLGNPAFDAFRIGDDQPRPDLRIQRIEFAARSASTSSWRRSFFSALCRQCPADRRHCALRDMHAPAEYEPLLKTFFTVSYVALAAFVGAFADSMPKWRVMFISNGIKIVGCS
jgi:hypothetical protein